jgi:CheY-like chemotaxis protein
VNPSEPLHENLQQIIEAARRSAEMTRQLLAFAREQPVVPQVLDLNEAVEGMIKMLQRLIGEDIDLVWRPGTPVWPVKIDLSQMAQALSNVCLNARDAIVGAGTISIETSTVSLDEAHCEGHPGWVPGEFVLLAVGDTGSGMDKKTLESLFEPFFTTKAIGLGTGLGLATVHAIVQHNNGFIDVCSVPGVGTTFKIYLPRQKGEALEPPKESAAAILPGHGETVLVVEAAVPLLNLRRTMLEGLGYSVLTAGTAGEAVRLAETHAGGIHLLIADVAMPDMDGRALSDHLHTLFPAIRTLLMSDYAADVIGHRGDVGVRFIQKPFSMKDLAARAREVLNQG